MILEELYDSIKKITSEVPIDSLEVVKQVEEYRQFWKPQKINVLLLAESHVYTNQQDYNIKCKKNKEIPPNYPSHFVRFVYCLGYGENYLLERALDNNMGTPQFWKIFSSCVANNEDNLGFDSVIKRGTKNLEQRLRNKVGILKKMQAKGVWLLDASIMSIYGSELEKWLKIKEKIIKISWDSHLVTIIKESGPQFIIIIGKNVEKILSSNLAQLKIPYKTIPQPQKRGTKQEQLERYKEYQRICSKYC